MNTTQSLTLPESLSRNPADGIQNSPPGGVGDHWFETASALVRARALEAQLNALIERQAEARREWVEL